VEKFLKFLEAAETDADFRAEIKTTSEPWRLAEHLTAARQTGPFDPDIYEDEEFIETERPLPFRRRRAAARTGEGVFARRR
jgi:hypothetical protein